MKAQAKLYFLGRVFQKGLHFFLVLLVHHKQTSPMVAWWWLATCLEPWWLAIPWLIISVLFTGALRLEQSPALGTQLHDLSALGLHTVMFPVFKEVLYRWQLGGLNEACSFENAWLTVKFWKFGHFFVSNPKFYLQKNRLWLVLWPS